MRNSGRLAIVIAGMMAVSAFAGRSGVWPPDVSVSPQSPDTTETVTLTFTEDYPNGCVYNPLHSVDVQGQAIYAHFSWLIFVWCPPDPTHYEAKQTVGPLNAGCYDVYAGIRGEPLASYTKITRFCVDDQSAGSGPVKFKGTVTVAEQHDVVPVCYGDYFVEVRIDEVLQDDHGLLAGVTSVEVCYGREGKGLDVGDRVEVYGFYYPGSGSCPKQYCRRVLCGADPYYIRLLWAGEPMLYTVGEDGVHKISLAGNVQKLIDAHKQSYDLEIRDNYLYVTEKARGGDIVVYTLTGNHIKNIPTPSVADDYINFVALPNNRFALLDNYNDKVFFINDTGHLLATTNILPLRDGSLQNVQGIVVGNRLILSQNGNRQVLAIDLTTYHASVFKDLSHLSSALGDITYADGRYYILAGGRSVYSFTESGGTVKVAELPESNGTGICVIGDFAYISVNFVDKVYKVDIGAGTVSVLSSGPDYPRDIECVKGTGQGDTGCFEVCMPVSLRIPDRDTACWTFAERWLCPLPLPPVPCIPTWAPRDAVVTKVEYKLAIRGYGLTGARCSDYEIYLDNDPCDTNPGLRVYNNLGGLTDGGHDDDVSNDRDIELDWRATNAFNGQSVHQDWTTCFTDTTSGYSGNVVELCLRICWRIDETPKTCCGFKPGDRVVLLTNTPPDSIGWPSVGLYAGAVGTVVCCDQDDPDLPLFVSWDNWTNGKNNDSFCDPPVISYTPYSGWWMACDDIAASGGGGGNGGCLPDLAPYLLTLIWTFTPETADICSSSVRLDVTYGIINSGCADSGNFRVCFYISTDNKITSSDHMLYCFPESSLAPGASGTWRLFAQLDRKELAPGTYYIGCILDSENSVHESNESNNVVVIPGKKLTIPNCSIPM